MQINADTCTCTCIYMDICIHVGILCVGWRIGTSSCWKNVQRPSRHISMHIHVQYILVIYNVRVHCICTCSCTCIYTLHIHVHVYTCTLYMYSIQHRSVSFHAKRRFNEVEPWIIERRKGIGNACAAPHVMYAMCKCQQNPCGLRAANKHARKFTLVANTEVSCMEVRL